MPTSLTRRALPAAALLTLAAAAWGQAPAAPAPGGGAPAQPVQPVRVDPTAAPAQAGVPVGPEIKREPPPLQAEPNTINMGFLEPETQKTGKVSLKNTGTEPVTIRSVSSSCSCTIPKDISNTVLKPGESVDLEASLKAGKFPGPMQRAVRVFVDGYAVPVQVWVNADVSYGVRAMPTYVDCFQTSKGKIEVEATDGKAFKIISVNGNTPTFDGHDPAKDEPRTKYTLTYDYTDVIKADPKGLPDWWLIETDHEKAPVVDMRVIHPIKVDPKKQPTGREPWNLMEDRVLLGAVPAGPEKEFHVSLHPNRSVPEDPANAGTKPVLTFTSATWATVEVLDASETSEGISIKAKIKVKESAPAGLMNEEMKIAWKGHEATVRVFGRIMPGGRADATR